MKYLFSLMNFSSWFEYKNTKLLTYFNETPFHKTTCQDVTNFSVLVYEADVSTFALVLRAKLKMDFNEWD